jgi:hypothetical protein
MAQPELPESLKRYHTLVSRFVDDARRGDIETQRKKQYLQDVCRNPLCGGGTQIGRYVQRLQDTRVSENGARLRKQSVAQGSTLRVRRSSNSANPYLGSSAFRLSGLDPVTPEPEETPVAVTTPTKDSRLRAIQTLRFVHTAHGRRGSSSETHVNNFWVPAMLGVSQLDAFADAATSDINFETIEDDTFLAWSTSGLRTLSVLRNYPRVCRRIVEAWLTVQGVRTGADARSFSLDQPSFSNNVRRVLWETMRTEFGKGTSDYNETQRTFCKFLRDLLPKSLPHNQLWFLLQALCSWYFMRHNVGPMTMHMKRRHGRQRARGIAALTGVPAMGLPSDIARPRVSHGTVAKILSFMGNPSVMRIVTAAKTLPPRPVGRLDAIRAYGTELSMLVPEIRLGFLTELGTKCKTGRPSGFAPPASSDNPVTHKVTPAEVVRSLERSFLTLLSEIHDAAASDRSLVGHGWQHLFGMTWEPLMLLQYAIETNTLTTYAADLQRSMPSSSEHVTSVLNNLTELMQSGGGESAREESGKVEDTIATYAILQADPISASVIYVDDTAQAMMETASELRAAAWDTHNDAASTVLRTFGFAAQSMADERFDKPLPLKIQYVKNQLEAEWLAARLAEARSRKKEPGSDAQPPGGTGSSEDGRSDGEEPDAEKSVEVLERMTDAASRAARNAAEYLRGDTRSHKIREINEFHVKLALENARTLLQMRDAKSISKDLLLEVARDAVEGRSVAPAVIQAMKFAENHLKRAAESALLGWYTGSKKEADFFAEGGKSVHSRIRARVRNAALAYRAPIAPARVSAQVAPSSWQIQDVLAKHATSTASGDRHRAEPDVCEWANRDARKVASVFVDQFVALAEKAATRRLQEMARPALGILQALSGNEELGSPRVIPSIDVLDGATKHLYPYKAFSASSPKEHMTMLYGKEVWAAFTCVMIGVLRAESLSHQAKILHSARTRYIAVVNRVISEGRPFLTQAELNEAIWDTDEVKNLQGFQIFSRVLPDVVSEHRLARRFRSMSTTDPRNEDTAEFYNILLRLGRVFPDLAPISVKGETIPLWNAANAFYQAQSLLARGATPKPRALPLAGLAVLDPRLIRLQMDTRVMNAVVAEGKRIVEFHVDENVEHVWRALEEAGRRARKAVPRVDNAQEESQEFEASPFVVVIRRSKDSGLLRSFLQSHRISFQTQSTT